MRCHNYLDHVGSECEQTIKNRRSGTNYFNQMHLFWNCKFQSKCYEKSVHIFQKFQYSYHWAMANGKPTASARNFFSTVNPEILIRPNFYYLRSATLHLKRSIRLRQVQECLCSNFSNSFCKSSRFLDHSLMRNQLQGCGFSNLF